MMLELFFFLRVECNSGKGRCRNLLPRSCDQHQVTFVSAQGEIFKQEVDFSTVTVLQATGTLGTLEYTKNS